MAERSNVLPWKGSRGAILSGVRIPLSPLRNKMFPFMGTFYFAVFRRVEVDENTGANVEPVGETARWCPDQSERVANFESRANPFRRIESTRKRLLPWSTKTENGIFKT